jgi:hypothetical protein
MVKRDCQCLEGSGSVRLQNYKIKRSTPFSMSHAKSTNSERSKQDPAERKKWGHASPYIGRILITWRNEARWLDESFLDRHLTEKLETIIINIKGEEHCSLQFHSFNMCAKKMSLALVLCSLFIFFTKTQGNCFPDQVVAATDTCMCISLLRMQCALGPQCPPRFTTLDWTLDTLELKGKIHCSSLRQSLGNLKVKKVILHEEFCPSGWRGIDCQ